MTGDKEIDPKFYRSPQGVVYERNPEPRYPRVIAVFTPSSHDTSWLYCREDGTYYWEHQRKNKGIKREDVDGLQLNIFGEVDLTKKFIMDSIMRA